MRQHMPAYTERGEGEGEFLSTKNARWHTHDTGQLFRGVCVCVSGNPLYSFSQIGWGKWNFLESEKEKRENKIQDWVNTSKY